MRVLFLSFIMLLHSKVPEIALIVSFDFFLALFFCLPKYRNDFVYQCIKAWHKNVNNHWVTKWLDFLRNQWFDHSANLNEKENISSTSLIFRISILTMIINHKITLPHKMILGQDKPLHWVLASIFEQFQALAP